MKKYLLSFILSVAGLAVASAQEPVQGIIATYDGSETSYMLEDMPTVMYETEDGVQHAVLYLQGQAEPVLNVALADGVELVITYGEYVPTTPTAIEDAELDKAIITERHGRKIIKGGKLIIISKDGKMYDLSGVQIGR